MKILIDPGHGGTATGATVGHVVEASLNLSYSMALAHALVHAGHKVSCTRFVDAPVSLGARCELSNALDPDLFLSIHCNWFTASQPHGMEVWTSPGVTDADWFATVIGEAMAGGFPWRNFRPDMSDGDLDREGNLFVLKNTQCPAVLVELGFMSNPEELTWLQQPGLPAEMAGVLTSALGGLR